jgi:hypothetical protein
MRDNNPVLGAIVMAIQLMAMSVEWKLEPAPDGEQEFQFVDECWKDMTHSWSDTLSQIFTMLYYGFSVFEIVYKYRRGLDATTPSKYDDGKIGWRKWAPWDAESLYVDEPWGLDAHGGLMSIRQDLRAEGGELIDVSIEKMLLFNTYGGSARPEGRSVLRNAYVPYYYATRLGEVEAIALERMGAGFPVIYASDEAREDIESGKLEQIVEDIRIDERGGVVLPYAKMGQGAKEGKGIRLELLNAGSFQAGTFHGVIERYEQRMAMSALAQFIFLGMSATGTQALADRVIDVLFQAIDVMNTRISDVLNRFAIPRLMRINGMDLTKAPRFKPASSMSYDLEKMGAFIGLMTDKGYIMPTQKISEFMHELSSLPFDESEYQKAIEEKEAQKEAIIGGMQNDEDGLDSEPEGESEPDTETEE